MFVFSPPSFICWNLIPRVIVLGEGELWLVIGSWGWTLKNGISVLIRDPRELSCSFYHVRTQQKDSYELGCGLSPDSESAGALVLDFPASGTVRNKFVLFTSHLVCGILLEQPEWTKTSLCIVLDFPRIWEPLHSPRFLWVEVWQDQGCGTACHTFGFWIIASC